MGCDPMDFFFLKNFDHFLAKYLFLKHMGCLHAYFLMKAWGHVSLKPRFLEEAHKRLGDLVILIVEGWKPYRE